MPMLFSLAIHNALAEVKIHLVEGEHLFAFLDDLCVLCSPVSGTVQEYVRDGVVDFGPEVWSPSSAKMLGTLVGSLEFVSNLIEERLNEPQDCGKRSSGCRTFSVRGRYRMCSSRMRQVLLSRAGVGVPACLL